MSKGSVSWMMWVIIHMTLSLVLGWTYAEKLARKLVVVQSQLHHYLRIMR